VKNGVVLFHSKGENVTRGRDAALRRPGHRSALSLPNWLMIRGRVIFGFFAVDIMGYGELSFPLISKAEGIKPLPLIGEDVN
jgi:hypothetical protein